MTLPSNAQLCLLLQKVFNIMAFWHKLNKALILEKFPCDKISSWEPQFLVVQPYDFGFDLNTWQNYHSFHAENQACQSKWLTFSGSQSDSLFYCKQTKIIVWMSINFVEFPAELCKEKKKQLPIILGYRDMVLEEISRVV